MTEIGDQGRLWQALRREIVETSASRLLETAASVAVTSVVGLPAMLQAGIAAATAGLDIGGSTMKRIHEGHEEQQRNSMFWAYEAGRRFVRHSRGGSRPKRS
jgi:hypothetical protein